jgi:GntR family transcriptional regulator, transcriptional repressor for pyruvate dehydrogenase complex
MLPSEAVMVRTHEVGRGTLREALRILEVQGLIAIKPGPGGGPVVAGADSRDFGRMATLFFHWTRATFRDLMEARLVMEPVMARLAAQRADEDVRAALEGGLEEMRQALADGSGPAYLAASSGFHAAVAGLSGNGVLDLFSRALRDVYTARVASGVALFPEEEREAVAREHEAIAHAILAGDGARAEQLMRAHMEDYAAYVTERLPALGGEILDWR